MTIYHGRYSKGFYKAETTKNSNPGGTFDWIGVIRRFNKSINPNLLDIRGTGSALRQYSEPTRKEFDVGAEFYVQDLNFIDQCITPTATYKTYTVEVRDSGDGVTYKYWLYTGVVLRTVSIRSRINEIVTATVGGHAMNLGVTGSTGIGTDPTDPATAPYMWHLGSAKVGGADAPEILETNIEVSQGGERRYGFVNAKPRDNIIGGFGVRGSLVFTTEGSTYVDDILGDVEQDLILYYNSTTHYITVSGAKFSRLEQPSEADTVLTETVGFEGKNAVVTKP